MEALKYRHEEKYMINKRDYFVLKKRLSTVLDHDPHASDGGEYNVRSLYFDDMANSALHEKLAGVSDRKKYRIRIYDNSAHHIYLEKKIKKKDYVAKRRQEISREDYDNIMARNTGEIFSSGKSLLRELALQMITKNLKPVVIVDYMREPFTCDTANVRITFDKSLKTALNKTKLLDSNLPMIEAVVSDCLILEVKYDGFLPGHIKAMIQLEGRYRRAISKYTLCRKYTKKNSWEDQ